MTASKLTVRNITAGVCVTIGYIVVLYHSFIDMPFDVRTWLRLAVDS